LCPPKPNELEIAAGLLDRFPTLPIQLLLLHDAPDVIKKAIQVGVSDCLYAPLHIEEIVKAVENSIKRADRIGDWTRREVRRTTASLEQRVDELQKFDTIANVSSIYDNGNIRIYDIGGLSLEQ